MRNDLRPSARTMLVMILAANVAVGRPAGASDARTLVSQVQIRRTQYGVPHIKGESLEAVAFGFGYCQAEDHLADILRGLLGARGELAENFGPGSDNRNIEADFFSRHYRIYRRAAATYDQLDPDYRSMLEGFAAGLNYYVARHRQSLPAWAPAVTGRDIAAYGLAGVMRFAFNRGDILRAFFRSQGVAAAQSAEPQRATLGSNMWALAPGRSQSGHALLMGNPHQPWAPVSTYYEAHLIVPGRLDFYGSTFIGRPILTSGWNEHLGWSHTVNDPDLEEIYELDLDARRPDHYLFDGASLPLEREDVVIRIKSNRPAATETRTFWHTSLGPVILRKPAKIYVLRSACYGNDRAYEQWLRMTQAKNFGEFRKIVEMNHLPMFNICYADREGNIFYLWNGTVPNLPHPAHRGQAVHATRRTDIWTKFHPTAELPQLVNPPGGYVQNCNSPPYLTNLFAPLDPARYPAHFSRNDLSLRTQHSLRLIHNDKKFTLEDVCKLKHSPLMLLAERVKGDLLASLRTLEQSAELKAAVDTLEKWDNTVASDSRGSTLFASWWERYSAGGAGKFAVPWSAQEPTATPRGLAEKDWAARTFIDAVRDVTRRYGRADVAWGDVHRVRRGNVDLGVSGGLGTMGCFRVLEFRRDSDGKLVANRGDSWVFAVEFSRPPKAYTVVAYSQSGVRGSPHYNDQTALFAAGKMKRAAFTEEEIQAQLLKSYRPGEE